MLSRRALMTGLAGSVLAARGVTDARAEAILTEDGLYKQPWFLESLLELGDDLKDAGERRKRFAIMWELRGCPACKQTHMVNFAKPEIESFVKDRFEVLQLNIIGSREVVDFDGEKLSEKALAAKYGVRYTPTFQFFADGGDGLGTRNPREREVARGQGYLEPKPFLAMFRYVTDRAYERGSLDDFLKANS